MEIVAVWPRQQGRTVSRSTKSELVENALVLHHLPQLRLIPLIEKNCSHWLFGAAKVPELDWQAIPRNDVLTVSDELSIAVTGKQLVNVVFLGGNLPKGGGSLTCWSSEIRQLEASFVHGVQDETVGAWVEGAAGDGFLFFVFVVRIEIVDGYVGFGRSVEGPQENLAVIGGEEVFLIGGDWDRVDRTNVPTWELFLQICSKRRINYL